MLITRSLLIGCIAACTPAQSDSPPARSDSPPAQSDSPAVATIRHLLAELRDWRPGNEGGIESLRGASFAETLDQVYDYDTFATAWLHGNAETMSEAERRELRGLIRDWLLATYADHDVPATVHLYELPSTLGSRVSARWRCSGRDPRELCGVQYWLTANGDRVRVGAMAWPYFSVRDRHVVEAFRHEVPLPTWAVANALRSGGARAILDLTSGAVASRLDGFHVCDEGACGPPPDGDVPLGDASGDLDAVIAGAAAAGRTARPR